ncbi:MAG TPA: 23S rRNA (adenine(2503)-C(2))-methyltransferase RlmN [Thermotogota bacterium]|nr:23S rRNA (adenine(2503)-C(2))-methyltransferase RlmN [Thermotogota bacterium]HRW91466.1 23S rRNA (adenine(2503)-C(2))-methyltransferase RlmN [Thermotogota bacterium]
MNVLDFTPDRLRQKFEELGWKKFRADQLCDWVYDKRVMDVQAMTNLSKPFREELAASFEIGLPALVERQESKRDGTKKYLFELSDGQRIESVLLSHPNRRTACISTQVGCPLKCTFCATGQSGYARNLELGEIHGQVLAIRVLENVRVSNIVFMGMGEPLLNLENVLQAVSILHEPRLYNIGKRHITISTAGIVPGIDRLADLRWGGRLSVSLHAPNNAVRDRLMPINHQYPVEEVLQAIGRYSELTSDRVTIEYALIREVNDSMENAGELLQRLKGMKVNVNLIPVNPVEGSYERSSLSQVEAFQKILADGGVETVVRVEKGIDIDAACGQLRKRGGK